ncbi:MAG: hypothetical protein QXM68_03405 [Candidatus Aenigmatarchaeota archaeon]|nr:hypothetical protein [Candidatus Aenigmarchaeota archaeon]
MSSEYNVKVEPQNVKIDDIEEMNIKIVKNKPWFLILAGNRIEDSSIFFSDDSTGSYASIKKNGNIEYREKIMLDNKIDVIRTIAITCGVLKLSKIVYSLHSDTRFTFLLSIDNLKGKTILENEDLGIFGEIKIDRETVKIKKEILFDKNFNAYKVVKDIIVDFCNQIEFPFDDVLLQKEIDNAISVLDNPIMFVKKI